MLPFIFLITQIICSDSSNYYNLISNYVNPRVGSKLNSSGKIENFIAVTDTENRINLLSVDTESIKITTQKKTSIVFSSIDDYTIGYTQGSGDYKYISYFNITDKRVYYKIYTSSYDFLYIDKFKNILYSEVIFPIPPLYMDDSRYIMTWGESNPDNSEYYLNVAYQNYLLKKKEYYSLLIPFREITNYTCLITKTRILFVFYSKDINYFIIQEMINDETNFRILTENLFNENDYKSIIKEHKYLKMLEGYPDIWYGGCLLIENNVIDCLLLERQEDNLIINSIYTFNTTAKYENILIKAPENLNGKDSYSIYMSWFEGENIVFIKLQFTYGNIQVSEFLHFHHDEIKSIDIGIYDIFNALLLIEDSKKNIGFYSMSLYLIRDNKRYIDVELTGKIDFSLSLVKKYNDGGTKVKFQEFEKDVIDLVKEEGGYHQEISFDTYYDNNIVLKYAKKAQKDITITFQIGYSNYFLFFINDCKQAFPFNCSGCEMRESITCTSCGSLILYEGICYQNEEFDVNKQVKKRKICSEIKDNGHCEKCASDLFFNELTDEYDKEDCIFDCAVYNGHRNEITKTCVKSCHPYEVFEANNNLCQNCKTISKDYYNYHGECIAQDRIPQNTYIEDSDYNYVEDCHPICNGCIGKSVNVKEPKCKECKSNYTLTDSRCKCEGNYGEIIEESNPLSYTCGNCKEYSLYNINNNCEKDKPPRTYIKDATYNILADCYQNCENCNKGGTDEQNNCSQCKTDWFMNGSNCVEDCPWNMAKNLGKCINCEIDNKYVDPGTRECVDEYPKGYYINNNVITKCPINCNDSKEIIPPNLQKGICENSENKCTVSVLLDGTDIEISVNPLPDLSSKLEEFTEGPFQDKVGTIQNGNDVLKNATYKVEDVDNILYEIVKLARITNLSHEEKQGHELNKQSIKRCVKSLSTIIKSDDLRDKYLSQDPAIKVETIALTSYYIANNLYYIDIDNGLELSKTENAVIKIISQFASQSRNIEDSSITNKQDFITIIGETTNTMISILNNTCLIDSSFDETRFNKDEMYKYQTALITEEVTKTGLTVLESNSKMINDLSSTIKHLVKPFSNIKYVRISLKDFAQELGPVDNEILVSNGECDYSYTEGVTNEYSVQVCIDIKSILEQFDTVKYLGLVLYSHYPLLNPNITKGVSKEFTAINLIDDNNHIIPAHHLFSNVSLVGRRDKGFENCLFKNDSLLLSNTNCTSSIINDHYLKCTCNHGTDFTLSSLNGTLIFNDFKLIFTQIRFIQSFDAFRLLSLSNAEALYIILLIVFIFVIVLIFAIKRDRKNHHYILFKIISDKKDNNKHIDNSYISENLDSFLNTIDDKITTRSKGKNSEKKDENDINNSNIKTKVRMFESLNQEIVQNPEGTAFFGDLDDPEFITLTNEIKLKTINQDPKMPNSLGNYNVKQYTICQWVRILFIIIFEFFKYQFWFSYLFLPYHNKYPKTIYVILFFLKIFLKFAVAALLATCNYKDQLSDSLFNNRRLAVSLLTILIVKIPVLIIGWLLSSKPVDKNKSKFRLCCLFFKYGGLFSGLIIGVIYGSANTIWITGDAFSNGGECKYKEDFLFALMGNLFLLKTSLVLLSAFVYFLIGRNYIKKQRINCGCIKMMACFPLLFTLRYQS